MMDGSAKNWDEDPTFQNYFISSSSVVIMYTTLDSTFLHFAARELF